jgi:hypothetical protein
MGNGKPASKQPPPALGAGMTVGQLRERLRYLPSDMPIGIAEGSLSDMKILSLYETDPGKPCPRVDGKETLWIDVEERT